jgi:hypothetical protein
MHSSLMSSVGVRPEVTRDNMGHSTVDVTQNVYNKTWWEERVEAVSMAAATVWREFMPTPQAPGPMLNLFVNPLPLGKPKNGCKFLKDWSALADDFRTRVVSGDVI